MENLEALTEIAENQFPKLRKLTTSSRRRVVGKLYKICWEEVERGNRCHDEIVEAVEKRVADDEDGFGALPLIVIMILSGVISWLVQRILDWIAHRKDN